MLRDVDSRGTSDCPPLCRSNAWASFLYPWLGLTEQRLRAAPPHPLLVSEAAAANTGRALSPTGPDGPTGTQALTVPMLTRGSEPQLWP